MTQLESALNNKTTDEMRLISGLEAVALARLKQRISSGAVVIPRNKKHLLKRICGIGEGLRTKINVNVGTSSDETDLKDELEKLEASVGCGADTVMDLSIAGDITAIRKALLKESDIPLGTVPVYQAAQEASKKSGSFLKMTPSDMLDVIETQAEEGVDFMTIHSAVTKKTISLVKESRRILDVVSRGGAILASWMAHNKKENPFYDCFDKILDIAYRYDVTLSLGDGLRPGSIMDATDKAQLGELRLLGQLARRARKRKVQVIIEGPGHVPLTQIQKNIELEKRICDNAPFYVLGPLVTDIASTRDHIAAAIGGALAASYGADFLCVVSPAEHLRHPSVEDIREGVIASRIAAHSADIAKGIKGASGWDRKMSVARRNRNWQEQIALSIDPKRAKEYRYSSRPHLLDVCTMCSEYCSIKLIEGCLRA
jgi:phosphomethylpyrimidine synthase